MLGKYEEASEAEVDDCWVRVGDEEGTNFKFFWASISTISQAVVAAGAGGSTESLSFIISFALTSWVWSSITISGTKSVWLTLISGISRVLLILISGIQTILRSSWKIHSSYCFQNVSIETCQTLTMTRCLE